MTLPIARTPGAGGDRDLVWGATGWRHYSEKAESVTNVKSLTDEEISALEALLRYF